LNRDTELLKIQVYADYCHTTFTFRASVIVSGYIGLLLTILVMAYQGLIGWIVYYLIAAAIIIIFSVNLASIFKDYHNSLDQIQTLLNKLENSEPLPTLKEMRKTRSKGK